MLNKTIIKKDIIDTIDFQVAGQAREPEQEQENYTYNKFRSINSIIKGIDKRENTSSIEIHQGAEIVLNINNTVLLEKILHDVLNGFDFEQGAENNILCYCLDRDSHLLITFSALHAQYNINLEELTEKFKDNMEKSNAQLQVSLAQNAGVYISTAYLQVKK